MRKYIKRKEYDGDIENLERMVYTLEKRIDLFDNHLDYLNKSLQRKEKIIKHLTKGKDILVCYDLGKETLAEKIYHLAFEKRYDFEELQSGIKFSLKKNLNGELELLTPMTRLDLVEKAKKMILKEEKKNEK